MQSLWTPAANRSATAVMIACLSIPGCTGSEGDAAEVARVPTRAGDVWVVDSAASRESAAAALAAFVSGMHVFVLDGETAYAGMTRIRTRTESDGSRAFRLVDGSDGRLTSEGEALRLELTGGMQLLMRRHTVVSEE